MKLRSINIKLIMLGALLLGVLGSCNKTDFNYPEGHVGVSKIVFFPAVSINGDRLIVINQGDTYTEPGAKATLNGADVQFTTAGTVDVNTPGVYGITYTAANPEGYTATDWRTVVVLGSDVAANDFSGVYLRAATGVTSTWTKVSNGVYSVENPGGSTGVGLTVIAVNYTGTKITIPHQISPDLGEVNSLSETYTLTPAPPTYTWTLIAGGYGNGPRTFVKQ